MILCLLVRNFLAKDTDDIILIIMSLPLIFYFFSFFKWSKLPICSLAIFVAHFHWWLGVVLLRQMFAGGFMTLAIHYLLTQNSNMKYFIFCFIAVMFHSSVILFFIFPFILNLKIKESLLIVIIIISFVSLGHVCRSKGSDLALRVAGQLQRNKIDFEWWFIGNMSEDCDYLQLAKEENVVDRVKFLGMQSNPYPYLKKADIVVHLSQYEGKSIALDEAKLLCKPIVVANYSTVRDQFTDHLNGSICERNVESATKAITELLENEILRQSYIEYLKFHINDNSEEINKIYNLVRDN